MQCGGIHLPDWDPLLMIKVCWIMVTKKQIQKNKIILRQMEPTRLEGEINQCSSLCLRCFKTAELRRNHDNKINIEFSMIPMQFIISQTTEMIHVLRREEIHSL